MKRRRGNMSDRGVSEVISVLLMVAVTIVLAAMVGSVLLDVVSDVEDTPLAAASVTFDGENDEIRVIYTSTQNSGTVIQVKVIDGSSDGEITGSPKSISEVGNSTTFSASDGDYTVRIIANAPDGRRAVVQETDGSL